MNERKQKAKSEHSSAVELKEEKNCSNYDSKSSDSVEKEKDEKERRRDLIDGDYMMSSTPDEILEALRRPRNREQKDQFYLQAKRMTYFQKLVKKELKMIFTTEVILELMKHPMLLGYKSNFVLR